MTSLSDNSWDCYLITIFACTNHNSGQQDAQMKINNQNSAAKTRVTTKRLLSNYLAVLVLLGSKYGWYSCTKSVVLKICKKKIYQLPNLRPHFLPPPPPPLHAEFVEWSGLPQVRSIKISMKLILKINITKFQRKLSSVFMLTKNVIRITTFY